jgi:hypothetical protein
MIPNNPIEDGQKYTTRFSASSIYYDTFYEVSLASGSSRITLGSHMQLIHVED